MKTKTTATISVAAAIMTGVWLYFTPHLTFHAMKSAAEASDSAALTEHIDFPALKENLKGTFNARFAAEMASHKDAEPFAAAGAMMVAAFINPMIDALVTPESIEQMMSGEKPLQKRDAAGESASSGADDIQTDMACESFDRFVLNVSQKGDTEPIGLVLKREGLFAWKPKAIRLPF